MATKSEVDLLRSANSDIVSLAQRDALRIWRLTAGLSPAERVAALRDTIPSLIAGYGSAVATVTADWYDDLRASSDAVGTFQAVIADEIPAEKVQADIGWAATPMFQDDVTDADKAVPGRLAGILQRRALEAGRSTIAFSVTSDPDPRTRWARVPSGATTCAFCLMTASRGAVYRSAENAGAGRKFHRFCDCVPTPVWTRADLPYDAGSLYERYEAARQATGVDQPSTGLILSELRTQQGIN